MAAGALVRERIRRAARAIVERGRVVALTGAGISVESGVPAFRGGQGLWDRFDPQEYATIEAFRRDPGKVWTMLFAMMEVLGKAAPNPAHEGLAVLERTGLLRSVITQNIDGLHQRAGSKRVIEYHGNPGSMVCLSCGGRRSADVRPAKGVPPRCACGEVLKPDVVFFGELIPEGVREAAEDEASRARVLLVIGTSATVYPACDIPRISVGRGAAVFVMNPEETPLPGGVSHLHLPVAAGAGVAMLLEEVRAQGGGSGAPR